MRKFIISAAIAASTLVAAAPAAAQWYPPQPQGNAYGYNNNYGQVRRLQARINQLQHQINRLDSRDILSEREARRLREESRGVEHRLRNAAANGLSGWESNDIERRVQRLEVRIQREARDNNNWRNGRNYNDADWRDRDRDGRNDRYEDDRGANRD